MAGSARQTCAQVTDGEGVWSWCPDAGIKSGATNPRATEAIKPGLRGERAISRKPIAQGMPGVPAAL